MARPLNIPRRYQDGLVLIRDCNEEAFAELFAALQDIPLTTNEDRVSSFVSGKVTTIPEDHIDLMIPALFSLYSLRNVTGYDVEEVGEGVVLGVEAGLSESADSPKREDFKARLLSLLDIEVLDTVVRAGNLLFENEHSLQQVRIISNVRPVFDPDEPGNLPRGAIVVHELKLSYYSDNELKDFFVSFDNSDIDSLRNHIDRAADKAKSLKLMLDKSGTPHIDAE